MPNALPLPTTYCCAMAGPPRLVSTRCGRAPLVARLSTICVLSLSARSTRALRRLLNQRFGELVEEPDEHRQRLSQLLIILVPSILGTVRDAKRLLAGFEMLHRPLRLEVDEVDLLGWAAVQVKYPDVEQTFRHRQEQIVGLAGNLFGEALLDRMLTGARGVTVDVTVKSPLGAAEELW